MVKSKFIQYFNNNPLRSLRRLKGIVQQTHRYGQTDIIRSISIIIIIISIIIIIIIKSDLEYFHLNAYQYNLLQTFFLAQSQMLKKKPKSFSFGIEILYLLNNVIINSNNNIMIVWFYMSIRFINFSHVNYFIK